LRTIVAIALLFVLSCDGCGDEQEWQAFYVAHHCKPVGYGKGGYTNTTSGSIVFLPDTVTYLCDDGIQYTRPR
jgi:hypothetical protein